MKLRYRLKVSKKSNPKSTPLVLEEFTTSMVDESFTCSLLQIFAYIKNRMICAIANNILNLKPFDFFVSDDPSPRFH